MKDTMSQAVGTMNEEPPVKREVAPVKQKKGLEISDLILIAVLLAAGAVLKFFVGSIINIGGMKPNFIIAMYCLAILIIRPKLYQAGIIGLIAGAICQLFPGTPYLNFISEFAGALTMGALIALPLKFGKFDARPLLCTFLATVVSGGLFVTCLFLFMGAVAQTLVAYIPIVLATALLNAIIVQVLYIPLKAAMKK